MPEEELYDLDRDPHEIDNLAGDPEHRADPGRLREVLDAWIDETDDQGRTARAARADPKPGRDPDRPPRPSPATRCPSGEMDYKPEAQAKEHLIIKMLLRLRFRLV